jgi:hypothetical protein
MENLLGDAGVGVDSTDVVAPVSHDGGVLQNDERTHGARKESL